jgi:hypothetical protein
MYTSLRAIYIGYCYLSLVSFIYMRLISRIVVINMVCFFFSCNTDRIPTLDLFKLRDKAESDRFLADSMFLGAFKFKSYEHNFGTINEGEVVSYVFEFTNVGQSALLISSVHTSCGCTSPNWTKHAVKPGESGVIEVSFNSNSKRGPQSPSVTIMANTKPSLSKLVMKGIVK